MASGDSLIDPTTAGRLTLLDDRLGRHLTPVDTIVQWIHGVASCLIV